MIILVEKVLNWKQKHLNLHEPLLFAIDQIRHSKFNMLSPLFLSHHFSQSKQISS